MSVRILCGDVREKLSELSDKSAHCIVTSPPYFGLRDYGMPGQIGLETSPEAYVAELVAVFREARRVLQDDGTFFLNLGDSYAGSRAGPQGVSGQMADRSVAKQRCRERPSDLAGAKPKDLLMIPARVALALQADGWYLRSDIIWHKPNPMPESVTDRPTSAHEHIFLLAKNERYFFDADAVREDYAPASAARYAYSFTENESQRQAKSPAVGAGKIEQNALGRNIRNVWTIATQPYSEAHFATFPPELAERCIKAGCPAGGTVLDPFGGAGTTALVADRLGRNAVLIELNPDYAQMALRRIEADAGMFAKVAS